MTKPFEIILLLSIRQESFFLLDVEHVVVVLLAVEHERPFLVDKELLIFATTLLYEGRF